MFSVSPKYVREISCFLCIYIDILSVVSKINHANKPLQCVHSIRYIQKYSKPFYMETRL
jgi:hypothetical protein